MKSLENGIVSIIGNTPLVHLTEIIPGNFEIYAKMESLNPGGSIKDRPALEIIRCGIEMGVIREGTVIVEATSGNMGVGLAQVCRYLGLRFICVTDNKITGQNLRLLTIYGAEIEIIEKPDPATGDLLQARINRARSIAASIGNSFWVNQYANLANARAHHRTMREIAEALQGRVDYVFCAASSCGTLRGCYEYLRMANLPAKLYAVDAPGSVIFGNARGRRLIPGHGAGLRPPLYQDQLGKRRIQVSDLECIVGCRRLMEMEGLLVGGTSGAVLMAIESIKDEIDSGANCVLIFPDRGERYLDTIFCDKWVAQHWGDSALHNEMSCRLVPA